LRAVITKAFAPAINLHRIQAAVRPNNARSLAVLQRLGFREEGLAQDYLFIDGAWRDHRLFAVTNPGFVPPDHWLHKDTA
jgi:ribosomal-protein-alanine N-acetyltransferase